MSPGAQPLKSRCVLLQNERVRKLIHVNGCVQGSGVGYLGQSCLLCAARLSESLPHY